jgi:hypothetical protein
LIAGELNPGAIAGAPDDEEFAAQIGEVRTGGKIVIVQAADVFTREWIECANGDAADAVEFVESDEERVVVGCADECGDETGTGEDGPAWDALVGFESRDVVAPQIEGCGAAGEAMVLVTDELHVGRVDGLGAEQGVESEQGEGDSCGRSGRSQAPSTKVSSMITIWRTV